MCFLEMEVRVPLIFTGKSILPKGVLMGEMVEEEAILFL
jgi:hypothetical protein